MGISYVLVIIYVYGEDSDEGFFCNMDGVPVLAYTLQLRAAIGGAIYDMAVSIDDAIRVSGVLLPSTPDRDVVKDVEEHGAMRSCKLIHPVRFGHGSTGNIVVSLSSVGGGNWKYVIDFAEPKRHDSPNRHSKRRPTGYNANNPSSSLTLRALVIRRDKPKANVFTMVNGVSLPERDIVDELIVKPTNDDDRIKRPRVDDRQKANVVIDKLLDSFVVPSDKGAKPGANAPEVLSIDDDESVSKSKDDVNRVATKSETRKRVPIYDFGHKTDAPHADKVMTTRAPKKISVDFMPKGVIFKRPCYFCLNYCEPGSSPCIDRIADINVSSYLAVMSEPCVPFHCVICPVIHGTQVINYDQYVIKYMAVLLRHFVDGHGMSVVFIANDISSGGTHVRLECLPIPSVKNRNLVDIVRHVGDSVPLKPDAHLIHHIGIGYPHNIKSAKQDSVTVLVCVPHPKSNTDPSELALLRFSVLQNVGEAERRASMRRFIAGVKREIQPTQQVFTLKDETNWVAFYRDMFP